MSLPFEDVDFRSGCDAEGLAELFAFAFFADKGID